MDRDQALEELRWVVNYLTVSPETLENPDSLTTDWTWGEQQEIALRVKAALEAIEAEL